MISIGSMMSLNDSYSLDDNDDDMEVTPSPHMRLKRKLSSGNIKTPPGTSTSPVFSIHINVCCELKLDTLIEWTYSCAYNTVIISDLYDRNELLKIYFPVCETNGSHKHFYTPLGSALSILLQAC